MAAEDLNKMVELGAYYGTTEPDDYEDYEDYDPYYDDPYYMDEEF